MISAEVDVAYQQLTDLERAISDLRNKNDSLLILNTLQERAGVLRDVLSVETEKIWGQLVLFSEEGDIQLTIQKNLRNSLYLISKIGRFHYKSTSFNRSHSGSPQVS
jgi:hypothetical protein